jgi:thiol-disulfide isomerase/thioredoxin
MNRSAVVLLFLLVLYAGLSVRLKLHLLEGLEPTSSIEVGKDAPLFVLEGLDGRRFDLAEVARQENVVVVNFWATWCGPCKVEMPQFAQLYEEHGSHGLEILAITQEDRETVEEFLRVKPYPFPILLDPGGEVTARYAVTALPTTIFVDGNGKVVRSRIGLDPSMERQVTRLLAPGGENRGEEGGGRD